METDMSRQPTASPDNSNTDLRNREIAQDAQTDTELESQVPPRSPGGTWWRLAVAIGAAVVLIGLLLIAI
jgi:hypothetical protein